MTLHAHVSRAVGAAVFAVLAVLGFGVSATAAPTPTPVPTAPTAAPTPGATATPAPADPSASPTGSPTPTPSPTQTKRKNCIRGTECVTPSDEQAGSGALSPIAGTGDTKCTNAPDPGSPNDGLAGWIDSGAGTKSTGTYGWYGYGGWGSYRYAPGCRNALNPLDGVNQEAGSSVLASWLMGFALLLTSAAVVLTRVAVESGGFWDLIDGFMEFTQLIVGPRFLAAYLGLSFVALGLFVAWRSKEGKLKEAAEWSWKAAVIAAVACACALWTGTIGATFDRGVNDTFSSISSVTSGEESGSAADATADAMFDQVIAPTWGLIHLGPNPAAIQKYAPRLHAASAFTRGEMARIQADPNQAQPLIDQKKKDWDTIAAEIQRTDPAARAVLDGKSTNGRPGYALIAAVGVAASLYLLLYALLYVALFRVAARAGVALFPFVGVLAVFPSLQGIAFGIVSALGKLAVVAAGLVAVYAVYLSAGIGGVLSQSSQPLWARLAALIALVFALSWLWKNRGMVAEKTGLQKHIDKGREVWNNNMSPDAGSPNVDAGSSRSDDSGPADQDEPADPGGRRRNPPRTVPEATLEHVDDPARPANRTVVAGEVTGSGSRRALGAAPTRKAPRRVSTGPVHAPGATNAATAQRANVKGAAKVVAQRMTHKPAKAATSAAVNSAANAAAVVVPAAKPVVMAAKVGKALKR